MRLPRGRHIDSVAAAPRAAVASRRRRAAVPPCPRGSEQMCTGSLRARGRHATEDDAGRGGVVVVRLRAWSSRGARRLGLAISGSGGQWWSLREGAQQRTCPPAYGESKGDQVPAACKYLFSLEKRNKRNGT